MKDMFVLQKINFYLSFGFIFFFLKGNAQTINAPIKQFGSICASTAHNSFTANFDFNGFPVGTAFALEMSDPNGNFSTLSPIQILSSQFATSPGRFTFSVPASVNTAGKMYKLRVKTTNYNPQVISSESQEFNAYYWVFNDDIKILGAESGSLAICGTTGKLSIDDTAPSPVQYPQLKYIWKKDNVILSGQNQKELTVTASGVYSVQVDYGNCNSIVGFLAYSKDVNVSFTSSSTAYTINSSKGAYVCSLSPTVLSTTAGQTYQWYLDGKKIDGATSYNYTANVAGTYKVVVSPGTVCESTSASFVLNTFEISTEPKTIKSPAFNYIQEGETITLKAIASHTIAPSPTPTYTYAWFEPNNNNPVSTSDSYALTAPPLEGNYKLVVTENGSCTNEYLFQFRLGVASVKIPNVITPNSTPGENDTWILPEEYKNTDTEVLIMDMYGKEVFKAKNYDDTWPSKSIEFKTFNPIFYYVISKGGSPIKKGSITVIQ